MRAITLQIQDAKTALVGGGERVEISPELLRHLILSCAEADRAFAFLLASTGSDVKGAFDALSALGCAQQRARERALSVAEVKPRG